MCWPIAHRKAAISRAMAATITGLFLPIAASLRNRPHRRTWAFQQGCSTLFTLAAENCESQKPHCGLFDGPSADFGFTATGMSDSLRSNLILDLAGCHETVFDVSRPPWKDRRPSPRRRQTLSSPPRGSVRDPGVDRRRQLIPVRPHIYPRASTSVAQAFSPEMAEGPSLHDHPRDLVATRSGWRRARVPRACQGLVRA